ncbi:MAG: prolipoprotein diacylglyceryl transferase [Burkholderiaceae bacterium]|jgi:phosphatidylglycerol:prolipoprotein diacylglycerol transferase|nr:prolipoprotein diacylglyceryl transferase [Burkholderiaceae bacterium]
MLMYPQIDPVAVRLGPLAVHWYGLTYMVAFGLFYWLGNLRLAHQPYASMTEPAPWTRRDVEDMLFYGVLGVIVGGRLGYVLFYKPAYYAAHLPEIFAVWQGGMSFHGGMLGVIAAALWWAHTRRRHWLLVTDFVAPCMPLGLASGRIGNFINGELWGRVADPSLPWAMIFPGAGAQPRHPSQIYEFLLEGLVLFALLWLYARKPRKTGQVSGAFLAGYGVLRFGVEFFREPDAFLGFQALGLSRGQWLCVPMILIGALMWLWASRRKVEG